MKRPKAVIINETETGEKNLKKILRKDVKKDSGLSFEVIASRDLTKPESLRKNSRLFKGSIYFIHEDPNNKPLAPEIARVMAKKGSNSGKVLTTQKSEPYKETMVTEGYEQFSGWLPKNPEQDFDVGEVTRKIQELRKNGRLVQPISIGIIGLGTLGLGILEKAVKSSHITRAHVYTAFVQGEYKPLLANLDLAGEEREKIITHGTNLEGVIQENPDVLLITTGKHGVDYNSYKDRIELTKMLFETTLPKINPILRAILANDYQGLIAMQSNPNGQLIRYARNLGIPTNQITSFPPDTVRHRAEVYEFLKLSNDPKVKEEDIHLILTGNSEKPLIAIGDHMKGGIPLYDECVINGKPLLELYPQLQDRKKRFEICQQARKKGLEVMQSAENFRHDYRGVPERVKECLEDISDLRRYSRYPIYVGLFSVPVEFEYKTSGDKMYVRVKRTSKITDLTKNKNLIKELGEDAKAVREHTKKWAKNK